jgi:hypothetical protein
MPPAPVASPCGAPVRGLELLRDDQLVLVGEMHGTEESPAFVARLLCERDERPSVLGLEIPASEQAALDAFLASDGEAPALRALVASPHWQRASQEQDGRSSLAMLALVETVRRARMAGRSIAVVAFDVEPGNGDDRDRRMAQNLMAARAAHPGAALIALTGNIHARTAKGTPWDPDLVPMGAHLRRAGAQPGRGPRRRQRVGLHDGRDLRRCRAARQGPRADAVRGGGDRPARLRRGLLRRGAHGVAAGEGPVGQRFGANAAITRSTSPPNRRDSSPRAGAGRTAA